MPGWQALARVPREKEKARAVEAAGTQDAADQARSIIAHSVESEAEAISSVLQFAPNDKNLQTKVEGLVDQLSGAWLLMTGKLTEQRKGNRIVFTLEQKEPSKESKPRNPKDAARARPAGADFKRVPVRKVTGPMNVYYYDYVAERANGDLRAVERIASMPRGEILLYEILNLVDGQRSVQAIHHGSLRADRGRRRDRIPQTAREDRSGSNGRVNRVVELPIPENSCHKDTSFVSWCLCGAALTD